MQTLQENHEILGDPLESESAPLPPRSFHSFSAGKNRAHHEVEKNNHKSHANLFPSLPAAAESERLPLSHSLSSKSLTRKDSSLSNVPKKLLCCLKVEIRSGSYKMLPVHDVCLYFYLADTCAKLYTQRDDPHQLAFTFCKSHNLLSSVSHLTEHIRQSKKTYGR